MMKTTSNIIETGVPDVYWGEFTEAKMDELLTIAEQRGFDAARVFVRDDLNREDFIFGLGRSNFINQLDIDKESVCLDCGCGLGAHTFNMARDAKEVHSFDLSSKRLRFVEQRKEAEGQKNIFLYHSNFEHLPFADGMFDVIIMNGVVEWLGEIKRFEDPREDQLAVLRKMRRLLKPGGRLYIGIENRYAAAYLRGHDHNGLRLTNFYPRFLADWMTRWKKGKSYRTYTYGARGYRKLLRESGFTERPTFFITYPGYNSPQYLIAHDDDAAVRFFYSSLSSNKGTRGRVVSFLVQFTLGRWLVRKSVWSYGIVTRA